MIKVTYKIRPTGISIFTGCGGMDIGFKRAGGQVLLGADYEDFPGVIHANNTAENNPDAPEGIKSEGVFLSGDAGDVTKLTAYEIFANIKKKLKLNFVPRQLDFLFGGPPCPPFSVANPYRHPFDNRATLIFEMLRLVRELKPKVVIIEQVPQIKSPDIMPLWNKLVVVLNSMTDYHWDHKVLNAKDFGGRQDRKRRIFYLVRKDLGVMPSFPVPTTPDMSKVSTHVLLPHISHFSSGQGVNTIHSAVNKMFLTITASASEWVYENGVQRKLTLLEKQVMTETEGQNMDGLTERQRNIAQGNMVSPSFMEALTTHAIVNFLKY